MEGTRPIRLTVAEMTPEDVRLAVAFAERELQLMQQHAAPALALLQRAADGDGSVLRWELHRARETAATLVRVQQAAGYGATPIYIPADRARATTP